MPPKHPSKSLKKLISEKNRDKPQKSISPEGLYSNNLWYARIGKGTQKVNEYTTKQIECYAQKPEQIDKRLKVIHSEWGLTRIIMLFNLFLIFIGVLLACEQNFVADSVHAINHEYQLYISHSTIQEEEVPLDATLIGRKGVKYACVFPSSNDLSESEYDSKNIVIRSSNSLFGNDNSLHRTSKTLPKIHFTNPLTTSYTYFPNYGIPRNFWVNSARYKIPDSTKSPDDESLHLIKHRPYTFETGVLSSDDYFMKVARNTLLTIPFIEYPSVLINDTFFTIAPGLYVQKMTYDNDVFEENSDPFGKFQVTKAIEYVNQKEEILGYFSGDEKRVEIKVPYEETGKEVTKLQMEDYIDMLAITHKLEKANLAHGILSTNCSYANITSSFLRGIYRHKKINEILDKAVDYEMFGSLKNEHSNNAQENGGESVRENADKKLKNGASDEGSFDDAFDGFNYNLLTTNEYKRTIESKLGNKHKVLLAYGTDKSASKKRDASSHYMYINSVLVDSTVKKELEKIESIKKEENPNIHFEAADEWKCTKKDAETILVEGDISSMEKARSWGKVRSSSDPLEPPKFYPSLRSAKKRLNEWWMKERRRYRQNQRKLVGNQMKDDALKAVYGPQPFNIFPSLGSRRVHFLSQQFIHGSSAEEETGIHTVPYDNYVRQSKEAKRREMENDNMEGISLYDIVAKRLKEIANSRKEKRGNIHKHQQKNPPELKSIFRSLFGVIRKKQEQPQQHLEYSSEVRYYCSTEDYLDFKFDRPRSNQSVITEIFHPDPHKYIFWVSVPALCEIPGFEAISSSSEGIYDGQAPLILSAEAKDRNMTVEQLLRRPYGRSEGNEEISSNSNGMNVKGTQSEDIFDGKKGKSQQKEIPSEHSQSSLWSKLGFGGNKQKNSEQNGINSDGEGSLPRPHTLRQFRPKHSFADPNPNAINRLKQTVSVNKEKSKEQTIKKNLKEKEKKKEKEDEKEDEEDDEKENEKEKEMRKEEKEADKNKNREEKVKEEVKEFYKKFQATHPSRNATIGPSPLRYMHMHKRPADKRKYTEVDVLGDLSFLSLAFWKDEYWTYSLQGEHAVQSSFLVDYKLGDFVGFGKETTIEEAERMLKSHGHLKNTVTVKGKRNGSAPDNSSDSSESISSASIRQIVSSSIPSELAEPYFSVYFTKFGDERSAFLDTPSDVLPRVSEVRIFCDEQANIPVLRFVNEEKALHYVYEVVTNKLCSHPKYASNRMNKHGITSAGICYPISHSPNKQIKNGTSSFSNFNSTQVFGKPPSPSFPINKKRFSKANLLNFFDLYSAWIRPFPFLHLTNGDVVDVTIYGEDENVKYSLEVAI
ncbi:uncharacterized protein MONOS_11015 [Monocercomonoides exilis]|uniref:uncharacterized protein n=1 Tax=Monocercomonoides exilis TaxID=2049356 RepID=UPI00355ABCF9|nr:hypothetical protein MONOS_11015 [Monocercomonoides exilis]|eukprot:MONOS_11015.1-p1 / transcript=MONOS_11015.1 / gene=MONOS_11015 / organism=Monocercomonoides_exilis_PA203 / gene_product=unspecified product / transcript_product=unspecified product / location=Mono_scaffold00528:26974-31995(+) / protein_length=1330 / sequence_SO=supercontig / SO=protein_coding / is_pseudo=false